jgi:acetyltransferase-like isoleucine patch superfamily enzyme
VFRPHELSPRVRDAAARTIHAAWEWVSAVGMVGPDDPHGRRFLSMGARSGLAFPPGPRFGEAWIAIGAETLIGPHVALSAGVPGEAFAPGRAVVTIGDRCNIGRGSSIAGRCSVTIEDDVMTGPNVYITDHNHDYADPDTPIGQQWPLLEAPVRIGAGSWLGAGVVVLPGADIGRHVTVGAGAVVRGAVADHTVVAGVPARPVR